MIDSRIYDNGNFMITISVDFEDEGREFGLKVNDDTDVWMDSHSLNTIIRMMQRAKKVFKEEGNKNG